MRLTVPVFNLLILFFSFAIINSGGTAIAQNIDFGKSYINVSKGVNGGTVETGDTLEIRSSFVVRSGTYDSCGYYDAIPAGTSFIPGTIRVLTNEGKIYKQFTDAYGDDEGWRSGSNITIHLGYVPTRNATAFRRGRMRNTYKPSFYGGTCIMVASFRVIVTAATGSTISTGGGYMTYKVSGSGTPILTFTFPSNTVMVYPNYGICSNTVGVNSIGTEYNGTFGSGQPRNRGTSANVPTGYTYNIFGPNSPQDYYYGVANNTSTNNNYTTLDTWPRPDNSSPTHRVFTVWDIIGDHTGAADPYAGNPAADTVANPNAGYMLIINAAYRIDSAFQQTISGLCPNTYYEISCWMRNICAKCGCDSNGTGASSGSSSYIPTDVGDSSGVRPNLTFEIDGIDYYTTGDLLYTGQWIKKGFTFLTGPAQTSFTLKFFNNAPGGGGNDWALDDISVSTCSPNMVYSPSLNPTVCDSNSITIYDTIRSYFNNYTYYKWQRSTDGGSNWSDVTGSFGPSSPSWNGTAWEYVTSYTIPPGQTLMSNAGDLYRVVAATTSSNLSDPNCSFTDYANIITLDVIDCGDPLASQLLSFSGKITQGNAELYWSTSQETEQLFYVVEKSTDGITFYAISTIDGYNNSSQETNYYSFTDPVPLHGKAYYRISISNQSGQHKYSRIIQLSSEKNQIEFLSVINPFSDQLSFDISSSANSKVFVELVDMFGKTVHQSFFNVINGINHLSLNNTKSLAAGIYVLKAYSDNITIQKKVVKQSSY